MKIQLVLFDLGSTLVYPKQAWPPVYVRAERALAGSLSARGLPLDEEQAAQLFQGFLKSYYAGQNQGVREYPMACALRDHLEGHGFHDLPDALVRAALDDLYSVTQQNYAAEQDALPTLAALSHEGYHLGLISNTSDDQNVHTLVERDGFEAYLEWILTSAGFGIRKPDERIFRAALDHFRVPPQAAAMVGDTLGADILGANRTGMYSIWITRRVEPVPEHRPDIPPSSTIARLEELPGLLHRLEGSQEPPAGD